MARRPIRQNEHELIKYLLIQVGSEDRFNIPTEVEELDDGGMGSIQLTRNGKHAGDLVKGTYTDQDGQTVLIVLTKNEFDELFDLDIWKVDFTPLLKFPTPNQVVITD